jgi:hypothetical protein
MHFLYSGFAFKWAQSRSRSITPVKFKKPELLIALDEILLFRAPYNIKPLFEPHEKIACSLHQNDDRINTSSMIGQCGF